MKKILKKIMPNYFINFFKKINKYFNYKKLYKDDIKRYKKSAFQMNKCNNNENLEAQITFYYHSLEKGLSNINFRPGFGKRALNSLFKVMEEYKDKGYPLDNVRFQTGLSVLYQYILVHKNIQYDVSEIEHKLSNLSSNIICDLGGVFDLSKEQILLYCNSNFKDLANHRCSVRDFDSTPVNIDLINEALDIAMKTPSVCNRQPWNIIVIKNKKMIQDVLYLQGGLTGYGNNVDTLISIASNNNYLSNITERNQGFIDCGMLSMSIIYALEYKGLASCALNACFNPSRDKEIRKLLSIKDNQNLVMFIVVGNYPDKFKSPKSKRDHFSEKTRYYY